MGERFAFDQNLTEHLAWTTGRAKVEHVRVFFVDGDGLLLRDSVVSEGDEQSVVIPIKAIVSQALALRAARMLVVHNHPSEMLAPSVSDRRVTQALRHHVHTAGLVLLEHLIVTRAGVSGILASLAASQ